MISPYIYMPRHFAARSAHLMTLDNMYILTDVSYLPLRTKHIQLSHLLAVSVTHNSQYPIDTNSWLDINNSLIGLWSWSL
jgi:hypothetical protein